MQNKTGSLIIEIEIRFTNNTIITFLIISIINVWVCILKKKIKLERPQNVHLKLDFLLNDHHY